MVVETRTEDEIREQIVAVLESNLDNPATDNIDVMGALASAVAAVNEEIEGKLDLLADEAFVVTASGEQLTQKARELGVIRQRAVSATGVVEFSREDPASTDYTIPEGTRVQTGDGSVTFETRETAILAEGETEVEVNVRAQEGGVEGNLPAQKLVTMPSPPTGVERVENLIPTGDTDFDDTDGNTLIAGEDRETDDELRERVLDAASIGGAATASSIETQLLSVSGVRSVTLFTNSTNQIDENGLPPYSSEAVVLGGNEEDIADALTDVVSVTELLRLQSDIIGNGVTKNRFISVFDQDVDVNFSRPVDVALEIDIDISTTAGYVGKDEIKDRIVEYVGGTRVDGSETPGIGATEDVVVDRITNAAVGGDIGVEAVTDLTIDTTGDGTDDRTTNADGVEVIEIATEEQATINADDISVVEV